VTTKNHYYSIAISERVVFLLDSINTSITLARLVQNRETSENRLAVANASLERTTLSLLSFEAEYGTIVPDREMEELMSVLADMKSRYVEANLTASAIRSGIRYGTTAQILELETQAEALRGAIEMLETGSSSEMGGVNLGPGIRNLPPALIEYARLRTDLEMQLKMVAALELQVGQAIIQEENIQSSIRILDPPLHPGWKSSPKRLFIWIQVFVVAFGFLCVYIFGRERWHTMREENPHAWKKWDDLLQDVRGDFRRKGSKRGKV
jgi:capsule polysaccharide export protein KpsE/RkpR